MSNNNSGPKNSKIISLFITFAILFVVVFGLGVIIGKGLGSSDTETIERSYDIESPEVEYGASDIDTEESDVSEMDSEEIILDEETESSIDEDSGDTETQQEETTKIQTPTQTPETQKTPEKPEPESKVVIEEKETAEVIVEKTPPTKQKSSKDDGAMPKIDPSGRYTVQIGAFQNQTEANKLVNLMKSNGYPAFIKQIETPDKKSWYRVRVGTFSTRSDALSYGDKLKKQEAKIKSVFITVNN